MLKISWILPVAVLAAVAVALYWVPPVPVEERRWQAIAGRDAPELGGVRFPLYHVCVPVRWQRSDAAVTASVAATTEPLCRFEVVGEEGTIAVTVHNFPCDVITERVDPHLQVARWQRQLGESDPLYTKIVPVHGGGFVGLHLAARSSEAAVMAWAMQLAPEHFHAVSAGETPYNRHYCRQRKADYTVKAVGPPDSVDAAAADIAAFAASFELLRPLP